MTVFNMCPKINYIMKLIWRKAESKYLFIFLSINFLGSIAEFTYGYTHNSMGLIADAVHMVFDSSAIALGLVASVIADRERTPRYTFGFKRAETIAGFCNAILLVCVSLFVMKEAVEKLITGEHVNSEYLIPVSIFGLVINLIGLAMFHGHGHGDGGCHGHGHIGHSQNHTSHNHSDENHHHDSCTLDSEVIHPSLTSATLSRESYNDEVPLIPEGYMNQNGLDHHSSALHGGSSQQCISHGSRLIHFRCNPWMNSVAGESPYPSSGMSMINMPPNINEPHIRRPPANSGRNKITEGVFLHILADTLGSISVLVSSICVTKWGLHSADGICSIFISIIVLISAYPLLRDSTKILMQSVPIKMEDTIADMILQISIIPQVSSILEYHVWSLGTNNHVATMKILVKQGSKDLGVMTDTIRDYWGQIGVNHVTIQLDVAA